MRALISVIVEFAKDLGNLELSEILDFIKEFISRILDFIKGFISVIKGFISRLSGNSGYEPTMSLEEAKFLITLTAKVAKSDGHINETEAEQITQTLDDLVRQSGGDREELKRVFSIEKNNLENVRQVALEYNKFAKLTPDRKVGLIYFFLHLAYIDGEFSQSERNTISQICDGFEISESVKEQMFARFQSDFEQARAWKNRYSRQSQSGYERDDSYGGNYGGSSQNYDNRGRGGYQNSSSGGGYGGSARDTRLKKDPYEFTGKDKRDIFGEKMSLEEAKILITLTAKVAKSDGVVNETEATVIGEFLDDLVHKMGGGENERNLLKQVYEINKDKEHDIYSLARDYREEFHLSKNRKETLFVFFFEISYNNPSYSERKDILDKIARGFGVEAFAFFFGMYESFYDFSPNYDNRGHAGYQNSGNSGENSGGGYGGSARNTSSKKDPYEVLGVDNGASFSEIKKKYRELVKKYHPDILMGKGADDEIIQEATKKLQEINEAYESLNERLGES